MEYISTRGVGQKSLTFEQTVLSGLAPDGGLYIPKRMPELPKDWEARWSSLSFTELALEIYSLFIPTEEISRAELKELIERSYSTFRHPEIAPLKKLTATRYVVELWHGPTFAFKDVALQFLGNLFEFFLNRKNQNRLPKDSPPERITVLGATSGDTGSAAIYGLRGKKDISIFILHPHGRVSPIQEAQMTTVLDDNVFNLAVKGTFDDCQDIVKSLFNDTAFNSTYRLGAINSINWARILAQIVYYFSSYYALRPTLKPNQCLQFIVPTGNFGDILAGFYAHKLGLPMGINGSTPGLVIATNSNDILTRFWETGKYEKQASDDTEQTTVAAGQTAPVLGSSDGKQASDPRHGLVKETLSPAMDILVSSNFERLLFYLAFDTLTESSKSQDERIEQSQTQVKEWMVQLKETGRFKVPDSTLQAARALFAAGRVDDQQTQHTILRYFAADKDLLHDGQRYVVDPHTAVGLFVAENLKPSGSEGGAIIQTVLSTAHPAKFGEAVSQSILQSEPARREQFDFERDVLPPQFVGLLDMPRRVIHVPGILPELTKNVVVAHSSPSIPAPNPPSSSV